MSSNSFIEFPDVDDDMINELANQFNLLTTSSVPVNNRCTQNDVNPFNFVQAEANKSRKNEQPEQLLGTENGEASNENLVKTTEVPSNNRSNSPWGNDSEQERIFIDLPTEDEIVEAEEVTGVSFTDDFNGQSTSVFNGQSTSVFESTPTANVESRPRMTRKQFCDFFVKHIGTIKDKSLLVFDKLTTLEKVEQKRTVCLEGTEFTFQINTLFDGGYLLKVFICSGSNEEKPLMFKSCVYLETNNLLKARLAMEDAVKLMPAFIDGSLSDPVSEFSTEYLTKRFIYKNEQLIKRYEKYSLYCRLCELHILSPNVVIDHIRSCDHRLLEARFYCRFQLCTHWNKQAPVADTQFAIFITNLKQNLQTQVSCFHNTCKREYLNKAFERLEDQVKGYSVRFFLFGAYQPSLITTPNPLIDCYMEILRIDGTVPTYEEKLKVFQQMPFVVQCRHQTAFVGYIVRWENHRFSGNFFFTFDPRAENAVLSSQLVALYAYLCPPISSLALLFRSWVARMGLMQPDDEYRMSGAILDYMVIYFFQNYYGIPVVGEKMVGSSIKAFLNKPVSEQLKIVKPTFDAFLQKQAISLLPDNFIKLLLYYGCGFNMQTCVQITRPQHVMKESLGFKTVKILDAIQDINIFDVRTEHAIFLDNMIFFACAEFLHLPNTLTYQNIAVESIGSFFRDSGYPFLVFTNDQSKISNVGNFFSRGFGSWNPSVIPRIESKCYFCHQIGHTEKRCPILKIVPIDNANPISSAMHDIFTRVIDTNYTAERLTEQHLKTAEDFIKQVESIVLARQGIRIQLKQFGSLKSGFGTNRSDLDLCIDLDGLDDINLKNVDEKERRAASIQLLQKIGDSLSADGRFDVSYVFGARVPILKFKYAGEDGTKFKADICCSNELALINTQLLATYASFDERVAPLCVAIKRWASVFAINDAAQHTFSSYSLAVMLIHFLQRVEPPVLPYLQDADAFGLESKMVDDQFEVSFARPNVDFMRNFRKNGMSLGQLFTAFFDYYNIFDWQDQVIQIRNSSSPYKFDKEWTRSTVSIEDPFELPHNLVGGIRTSDYLIIRKSINIMQHEFRNSKSIFYQSDFTFTSKNYYYLRAPIQRSNVNAPACHNCGETGHYKASCPNEKKKPGATPSNNRSNFRTPNGRTRSQNFASTSRQQNFVPTSRQQNFVPTSRQQNGNDQSKVKFFN